MIARRFLSLAKTRVAVHAATMQRHQPVIGYMRDMQAFSTIVHSSPHKRLNVPRKTIWDIVEDQAHIKGDKTAFICGVTHERITFKELYEDSKRLAVALAEDGVRKGDAVIVHSFNCIEYPTVVLAITALGAVVSPSSPMFLPNELAYQIKAAKANYIIAHEELEKVAVKAAKEVGVDKKHVYTMGKTKSLLGLRSINDLAKRDFDSFKFEKIDPELNLLLPFSSGTTGNPKGVALSARNMIANILQVDSVEKLGDHSLGLLPFFHIYGLMMMHLSMYQGTAKVILPRFEPDTFLTALEKYKIQVAHIAPPVALFLANSPLVEKYDISATKYLVSGGAPMGIETEALVKARLGVTVKQAYGMTEASPAVNYSEDGFHRPGSVGRLVPSTELKVKCTKTDVDLPVNAHGELLYRGPQVMIGYLDNQEANQSVFTDDRFLRTGDIGYIDEDGYVFVVDRVKELIKYKGHQVAPAEIEDILNHHPAIADSCCIRGKDKYGEEIPKAFVVLKDPSNPTNITAEEVMDFVEERVAPFKKVRQLEFIDAIPKSASGKILRRQLQAWENANH